MTLISVNTEEIINTNRAETGGNMSIKVLTDEQIETLLWNRDGLYNFARAIEKAVLQSPKVQGLLNALQEVVDAADGDGWKVLDPSFEKQRAALAAMKKQQGRK